MRLITCRPKSLPLDKLAAAAKRAIEINPDNALERRQVVRTPVGRRGGPRRIAVVVARRWPPPGVRLSVSFMDNPPRALRSRILLHMNAWGESANVRLRRNRRHRPGAHRAARRAGRRWRATGRTSAPRSSRSSTTSRR